MVDYPSYYPTIQGDLLGRVNLLRFIREFCRIHEVGECYAMEFGVLNGESLIEIVRQLRGFVTDVVGFDSFEGLPELTDRDAASLDLLPAFHKGQFSGQRSAEVGRHISMSTQFPEENISLIEGYYSDTLRQYGLAQLPKKFPILVHMDCDLYSSTCDVLDFITDVVQDGTFLLADDFWCYRGSPKHGQHRAILEWEQDNGRVGLTPYSNYKGFGRAFIAYLK